LSLKIALDVDSKRRMSHKQTVGRLKDSKKDKDKIFGKILTQIEPKKMYVLVNRKVLKTKTALIRRAFMNNKRPLKSRDMEY